MREKTTIPPSIFTVTLVTLSRQHHKNSLHPPPHLTTRSLSSHILFARASRGKNKDAPIAIVALFLVSHFIHEDNTPSVLVCHIFFLTLRHSVATL